MMLTVSSLFLILITIPRLYGSYAYIYFPTIYIELVSLILLNRVVNTGVNTDLAFLTN